MGNIMFKFSISDEFRYFAGRQITQIKVDPDFYLKMSESEYKAIKDHIGTPKEILELGCVLGRMSIYINYKLDYDPYFILADVTKESKKIKYGWDPENSYYNSLELTDKFAKLHGLSNFKTHNLLAEDLNQYKNIDLVMSYLAVGFHYPIDQYMSTLLKITSDDCTMVFGVRRGKYNISDYEKYFSNIFVKKNTVDTKEDLLILKGKR